MATPVGAKMGAAAEGVLMLIWDPSAQLPHPAPDNTEKGTDLPPTVTEVAPLKFEPLMMTDWPPASGPVAGVTVLIVGGAVDPNTNADAV